MRPLCPGKTYADLTVPPRAAKAANPAGNGKMARRRTVRPRTGPHSPQQNRKSVKAPAFTPLDGRFVAETDKVVCDAPACGAAHRATFDVSSLTALSNPR